MAGPIECGRVARPATLLLALSQVLAPSPVWWLDSALHSVVCPPVPVWRAATGCAGRWLRVLWAPGFYFSLRATTRPAACGSTPWGWHVLVCAAMGAVRVCAELTAAVYFCVPTRVEVARLTIASKLGVHSQFVRLLGSMCFPHYCDPQAVTAGVHQQMPIAGLQISQLHYPANLPPIIHDSNNLPG